MPALDVRGAPGAALPVVVHCDARFASKAHYVLETLLRAAGLEAVRCDSPPASGPWLLYAPDAPAPSANPPLRMAHCPSAWHWLSSQQRVDTPGTAHGLSWIAPHRAEGIDGDLHIDVDLVANAFYFLSSWAERSEGRTASDSRQLFSASEFERLKVPQDIVDRYLALLIERLRALYQRAGMPPWPAPKWPQGGEFAVVLSHDVDYLPVRRRDNAVQAAKAIARHLIRQRDPADAARAAWGWLVAVARRRDPYGCVPEIIGREQSLGVKSSFQVAVARRHANDVNYSVEDEPVRRYLQCIVEAGFDLCLHGSFRSTEKLQWYIDEVEMLAKHLARPRGSRQHFLSFDYDILFAAQEQAGIEYDMSLGYPDRHGPRAGFSYPYFPYNLREDRPYQVLQIPLFLMDVTLRSYLGLRPAPARAVIAETLAQLRAKRGAISCVWHPIVFGNARDPGYGQMYFDMISQIEALGGWAGDGRTLNSFWRAGNRAVTRV